MKKNHRALGVQNKIIPYFQLLLEQVKALARLVQLDYLKSVTKPCWPKEQHKECKGNP